MLVVVTGGSGSGKSAFAEDRVLSFGESRRIYIATMQAFDEESHRRIRRHRRMRSGKGFETIERYTELDELILPKNCVVLLECMSNLVANEMFREDGFHPEAYCSTLISPKVLMELYTAQERSISGNKATAPVPSPRHIPAWMIASLSSSFRIRCAAGSLDT